MIRLEKNGAIAEIEEMGAEIRRYCTADGKERLWSGDAKVWAGVAPVLFPSIGNLKDGKVKIEGKDCAIPKHGFAKISKFRLESQSPGECSLVLEDSPETRAVFPFAFRLTVTHRLLENGFETDYLVENKDHRPMPFLLGGHAGYTCPMNEGEAFSDYVVRFEQAEEGRNLMYSANALMGGTEMVDLGRDHRTLALEYASYDQKDTLVFTDIHSRSVDLIHRETGKGIRLSFPQSPVLAIWTKPHCHAPYVCLEPWIGIPAMEDETGHFEDKPFHKELAAGDRFLMEQRTEILA